MNDTPLLDLIKDEKIFEFFYFELIDQNIINIKFVNDLCLSLEYYPEQDVYKLASYQGIYSRTGPPNIKVSNIADIITATKDYVNKEIYKNLAFHLDRCTLTYYLKCWVEYYSPSFVLDEQEQNLWSRALLSSENQIDIALLVEIKSLTERKSDLNRLLRFDFLMNSQDVVLQRTRRKIAHLRQDIRKSIMKRGK